MSVALNASTACDARLVGKYAAANAHATLHYPSAAQLDDDFGVDDYRRMWQQPSSGALALQLRIPFCESACFHCTRRPAVGQDEQIRPYLDHLKEEIRLQAQLVDRQRPVTRMHWGGGTPTRLSAAELTELMHCVASHFHLLDHGSREYSIEIDPRSVDHQTLALLKGLGFNRIVVGIKDFDADVLHAINRAHSLPQLEKLVEAVRTFGFRTLSFELLHGLPLQSLESMRHTLRQAIALGPDRIAFAGYHHQPRRFAAQRAVSRRTLPTAAQRLQMQILAESELAAAGYDPIGADLYTHAEDELAQAQRGGQLQCTPQGYSATPAQEQIGLGLGAVSYTADAFAQNVAVLERYGAMLEQHRLPVARGLRLSRLDQARRQLLSDLACKQCIDPAALELRHGIQFEEGFRAELQRLGALVADGLLQRQGRRYHVTSAGRPLLRAILQVFGPPRPAAAADHR